ncbi:hypothetical protein HYZ64_01720, partial [Candidatus Berkelbacteria bacterium]|nr:hypothetical protein [Candidatus Berkelbacteria bacterium]
MAKVILTPEFRPPGVSVGLGRLSKSSAQAPVTWITACCLLCFGVLFIRLLGLQIVDFRTQLTLAEGNRIRSFPLTAPRGVINDRFGRVIVDNRVAFELIIRPFDLPRDNELGSIDRLAELSGLSKELIRTDYQAGREQEFVVIRDRIPEVEAINLKVKLRDLPGVAVIP